MDIKKAFCIPIVYDHAPKTCIEKFTERVDGYFYFGGKRLHVEGSKARVVEDQLTTAEKCLCVLKAISCIFLVVPLFFIISKLIVNPRDKLTDHYTDPTPEGFTLNQLVPEPKIERTEPAASTETEASVLTQAPPTVIDLTLDEDDDSDRPVVKAPIGTSYVTKRDLDLVTNTQWLNDSYMNTYFEILASDHPDVCIGNSLAIVLPSHRHKNPLCPYLKGNGKRPRSLSDPISSIYVPLNIGNRHWALLVIDPLEKKLRYYDSLSWEPAQEVATVRENLSWISKTSWDLIVEKSPQQTNASDCGVYVCHTAMCLMQGKSIEVTPDDIVAFRKAIQDKFNKNTIG